MTVDARQSMAGAGKVTSLEELQDVLQMYDEVMRKLQVSHERLEAEVTRLREQLEQKNRELELKKRLAALGEMAAGIAHEIRNPLGGIQLYASTLAREVEDRPLAAELVAKISKGVKGLNTLVSDMLAFTRDLNLNKRDAEVAELVEAAVEVARPVLLQHGVEVRVNVAENLTARLDPKLLERVLVNLVANAAEAVGEARESGLGNRESGLIVVRATRMGPRVEISVEDNGPGMAPEVIERVFNPFFTTKHTGTGLGLAIVHRIVEAHGGTITAENRPQGGARFVMVI